MQCYVAKTNTLKPNIQQCVIAGQAKSWSSIHDQKGIQGVLNC